MSQKKLLFIYNPRAGKELLRPKLSRVIELLMQENYRVTIYATSQSGEATQIVQREASKYHRIICAGGDGTLHEVMVGLMKCDIEDRCPCGFIPAGTTNDFANTIFLPKKIEKAAMVAATGEELPYDIGSMNGEYFNYIAAFGAFTSVSYETPQPVKNILGKAAYFLQGLMQLPAIHPYHVVITTGEGEVVEDDFIFGMVTNANSVGGFPVFRNTNVSLNDGLFEGVFVKNPRNPIEFQALVNSFMTASGSDQIVALRSSSFEIQSEDEISYTLDGENGGNHKKVSISNHYQGIRYIWDSQKSVLDKKYKKRQIESKNHESK